MDNNKYGRPTNLEEEYLKQKKMHELAKQEEKYYKLQQLIDKWYPKDDIKINMEASSIRKRNTKSELESRLNQTLRHLEESTIKTKDALEKIKEMKYDVGHAVFHERLGNVIIKDIYLESEQNTVYLEVKADFSDGYVYQVVGADGSAFVKEDELMEITNITKDLYGK